MRKMAIGEAIHLPDGNVAPLSAAFRAGGMVYTSGQLAFDERGRLNAGAVDEQTALCLANIERILRDAGLTRDDVIKVAAWLTDAADFANFNRAYANFFGDHRPARSTVRCDLMLPGARVEIEAIAAG